MAFITKGCAVLTKSAMTWLGVMEETRLKRTPGPPVLPDSMDFMRERREERAPPQSVEVVGGWRFFWGVVGVVGVEGGV